MSSSQWPPPEYPLVEGEYSLTSSWTIELPESLARRVEDGSLVLWRPGLTIWIDVWDNPLGESRRSRLEHFRASASETRLEEQETERDDALCWSYRLREQHEDETREAVYATVLADAEHLHVAAYFDDAAEAPLARTIVESTRFKEGATMAKVARDPALDQPATAFEVAVAAFDRRLAELREEGDAANNRLTPGDAGDLAEITKRWKLPELYLDFLTRFSPLNVQVPLDDDEEFVPLLSLYGAADLIEGQVGYGLEEQTHQPLEGWPEEYVVIGSQDGNPYVLDLSRSDGQDAPVLAAEHGQDSWDFYEVADSFQSLLEGLTPDGEEEDFEERLDRLNAKIDEHPEQPKLYLERGLVLLVIEAYEPAEEDFSKALELGLKSPDVYEGRGTAAFALGEMEQAVEDLTQALELRDSTEAYCNRGRALFELGRVDEATADLDRAIELDPKDPESWYHRGRVLWQLQENDRAESDFSRAIELSEGDEDWLDDCYLSRGGLRCNAARTDEALADLNECLELNPSSDYGYVFRGNTFWRMKRYQDALTDFEQALHLDDEDAYVVGTLAWYLATCESDKVRDAQRSLKLAKSAVKLGGDGYRHALAAAQAQNGEYKEAVKAMKVALEADADSGNEADLKKYREALSEFEAGRPYLDREGG